MKQIFISLLIALCFTCCSTQKQVSAPLKGRLEIKGACAHYVIKILSGKAGGLKAEKTWTNPSDGKIYTNVFTVQNYCSFPADIKEGEEFYFEWLTEPPAQNCMRCMIFVPTPETQNAIKVQPHH